MEKKIVLTMRQSKDIDVVINDQCEITISKDQRMVKADDIYNLLSFFHIFVVVFIVLKASIQRGKMLRFFNSLQNYFKI